jgi:hypothetical protein
VELKNNSSDAGGDGSIQGGGVSVNGGTFLMTGGKITANTVQQGGGVWISNNSSSSFTMEGGEISYNFANEYGGGGGVYVAGSASFTMSGSSSILSNRTTGSGSNGSGGGVKVNGTFTMSSGQISANSAAADGDGVYISSTGTFNMSGSAVVNSNNDVYLSSEKTITITGNLSGAAPVATITPAIYATLTTPVLTESGGTYLDGNYGKFAVTPQAGPTYWSIVSDGKLGIPAS